MGLLGSVLIKRYWSWRGGVVLSGRSLIKKIFFTLVWYIYEITNGFQTHSKIIQVQIDKKIRTYILYSKKYFLKNLEDI